MRVCGATRVSRTPSGRSMWSPACASATGPVARIAGRISTSQPHGATGEEKCTVDGSSLPARSGRPRPGGWPRCSRRRDRRAPARSADPRSADGGVRPTHATSSRTASRRRPRASGGSRACSRPEGQSACSPSPSLPHPSPGSPKGRNGKIARAIPATLRPLVEQPEERRDDRFRLRAIRDVLAREGPLMHLGPHVAGVEGVHAQHSVVRPQELRSAGRARPWPIRSHPTRRTPRRPRRS